MSNPTDEAVAAEQEYVSMLYDELDSRRARATSHRADVLAQAGGTPQGRLFREDAAEKYTQDLVALTAVESGLCFGRLDLTDGQRRYIGRMGLFDSRQRALLVDWRADAARDFYLATAANPGAVYRRRHIHSVRREVTGVSDEILDLAAERDSWREEVTGEAALLAALDAGRTGKMGDIVATIQAEQDRIIRSELDGILVVAGGPGTGKTAVALHRAAYLLYQHRRRLAGRGVLVIGPNAKFLRYIADVLPGLAETDVLLSTIGDLFPDVTADRVEDPRAAAIKGDGAMIEVMRVALADRQRLIDAPIHAETEYGRLTIDPVTCAEVRGKIRATGKTHNAARPLFDAAMLDVLTTQVAERIGADPLGGENLLGELDLADVRAEIAAEPEVQAVLDWLWPKLTPQQLLAGLLGSAKRLATAAGHLEEPERKLLLREPHSGWTAADAPLLDEAAELLGELIDPREQRRREQQRAEHLAYAQGVLDIVTGSRSIDVEDEDDPEVLMATDVMDAALLGERQADAGYLSTAERAASDRTWSFGHVVVDEAQELSAMDWRMIMRRCASRSMTVVGDLAQTSALSGVASWSQTLQPYAPGRWRVEELTVSYRTPAEILDVAAESLAVIDPDATPPRAVRSTGEPPWDVTVDSAQLHEALRDRIASERDAIGEGRIGVIAPSNLLSGPDPIRTTEDFDVDVLSVSQAKGLEYDAVIVVDPDSIVAASSRGHGDLYVALTRATRRLGVIRPAVAETGGIA